MAMEMACSRGCCSSVSAWGRRTSSLDSRRRQRLTLGRISRPWPIRVAEDVSTEEDCNEEDCAPVKEVGKLSLKWEAEDNTKVAGTYPPLVRERRWTGYVEKDTAGQTNIYAVEPTVYVAENVFSSGETGGTSEAAASRNTVITSVVGFLTVAVAAFVLTTMTKNAPSTPAAEVGYSGPPLSYYIEKFTPEAAERTAPTYDAATDQPTAEEIGEES